MLKNLLPSGIKTALKLSFGLWILGVICVIPFMFLGFNLMMGIKVLLFLYPFVIMFVSTLYLKRVNKIHSIKEGGLFGLFLVLTHLPSDLLFMLLFFKEGLIIFKAYWGILFYGEMLFFSMIAGLFVNVLFLQGLFQYLKNLGRWF